MRKTSVRILAAILILLAVTPGFAETGEFCGCDPAAVTAHLRQRIQSHRYSATGVKVAFSLSESPVHQPFSFLRGRDCIYVATGDLSGLVDILLRANIGVGYPKGWEHYKPEARYGVFLDADQPGELDLWFSQPLHFENGEFLMVGQSYDQEEATASRISGAATLANDLLKWAHDHAYPTPQAAAAKCHLP